MLQACDVAIEDSTERVIDMMVQLLKDFTSSFVVTPDQFDKVCAAGWDCSFCLRRSGRTITVYYIHFSDIFDEFLDKSLHKTLLSALLLCKTLRHDDVDVCCF